PKNAVLLAITLVGIGITVVTYYWWVQMQRHPATVPRAILFAAGSVVGLTLFLTGVVRGAGPAVRQTKAAFERISSAFRSRGL
ncbi:hypothetical protein BVRB_031640, partial [Beta vulgaris subsp. vulgaris]